MWHEGGWRRGGACGRGTLGISVSAIYDLMAVWFAVASHERRGCHVKELTTLGSWLRSGVAARPVMWSIGCCVFA